MTTVDIFVRKSFPSSTASSHSSSTVPKSTIYAHRIQPATNDRCRGADNGHSNDQCRLNAIDCSRIANSSRLPDSGVGRVGRGRATLFRDPSARIAPGEDCEKMFVNENVMKADPGSHCSFPH